MEGRFIVLFDTLPGMKIDERGDLARSRPIPRRARRRVPDADVVRIDSRRRSKFPVRGICPEIVNFVPAAQHSVRERSLSLTHWLARRNGRVTGGPRCESLGQGDWSNADDDPNQEQATREAAARKTLHGAPLDGQEP